jgi:carbonic anhydrase/acetyltransferase-like protein (isoleucine patch superfamily)
MLVDHEGHAPQIHPTARVAPNALVCGEGTVGANCSIGFGAVLVAERGPVRLAVLRGVRGAPLTLGDNVLVGPRSCLTRCTVTLPLRRRRCS